MCLWSTYTSLLLIGMSTNAKCHSSCSYFTTEESVSPCFLIPLSLNLFLCIVNASVAIWSLCWKLESTMASINHGFKHLVNMKHTIQLLLQAICHRQHKYPKIKIPRIMVSSTSVLLPPFSLVDKCTNKSEKH